MATDKEKKDKMVERAIAADASRVSLFSWEERTYNAVDAGSVKKIIPTLKGSPVTWKRVKNKYPASGSKSSLKIDETMDSLK